MNLAIVIPYYKLSYFGECLESLKNQTNQNFNVYIGNDASLENPEKIIAGYSKFLKITYVEFDSNLGATSLTKQWERCISLVEDEEWIMVLGDDDKLESSVIESFFRNYQQFSKESNIVRFASQTIDSSGEALSGLFYHPKLENAEQSQFIRMLGRTRSTLSEYVFKKEVYLKKGFRDLPLAWHSDDLAWLDFSENKPIFTINESAVYVRNSGLNISSKTDNLNLKQQATLQFYNILVKEKKSSYTRQQIGVILKRYEDLKQRRKELCLSTWNYLFFNYLCHTNMKNLYRFLKRTLKKNV